MDELSIAEKRRISNEILSSSNLLKLTDDTEKFLNRFDNSVNKIKDTFQEINSAMKITNDVIQNVSIIWQCTLDTVRAVKEIDLIMKQMDVNLEMYLKDSQISLEKFKTNAPILEKQLDNISNRIDKILDKALAIDSKNCELIDLELRSKLITQVRDWSDHLSSMMMKLMSL
ncbi:MAG: hypothetical protein N2319_04630 [Candidatus Kapabacteria bacterium]|nr:hypothetical protein [Candidatus Kapabacteria bacterium]